MKHPSIRPIFQHAPDSSLQYTYTTTIGSRVYIRGRDTDGHAHFVELKYAPTYYLPTREYTGITTLDGAPLLPHRLDSIQEGRDFLEQHPEAYGNIQCEYMALADTYGDVEIIPDMERLYIWNLDIETASDIAFAPPEDPFNEITAITVRWRHRGESGVVVYGTKPYTAKPNVTYHECANEAALLTQFIADWRGKGDYPDIVTGYNVQFFDMPYLVNRIRRVLSEEIVLKLSPFERITNRMVTLYGRDQSVVDIRGIAILDYLELYKKFTYTQQESYRLDHIAHVELGKRKLSYEEYKSLATLYRENYQLFIDYNIQDVELVDELDQKLKLIELVCALAYSARANYVDTFRQVRLWDIMIYHYLRARNVQIPARREVEKTEQYAGAYVKDPLVGQHEWVVSFDVASMYPHIIREWNLSPETLLSKVEGKWHTIDALLSQPSVAEHTNDGEYALAANGVQTRRDVEGFLPAMLKTLYDERTRYKNMATEAKKARENVDKSDPQYAVLTKQIAAYNNQQMVRKVNLNSAYGALGSNYFRFYDTNLAEAVTLTGQLTIRWIANAVNAYLNENLGTNKDYIIASDTDSIYINLGPLVAHEELFNGQSKDRIVTMLDRFCEKRIQKVIDRALDALASYLNVAVPCLSMKREVIADKGVWTAKKRYMLNVYDTEGVRHASPKLKMMGIEAVKSSTPAVARTILTRGIELLLRGTQEEIWALVAKEREKFMQAAFDDIAMPRSVNGLRKYSRTEKGIPIHVAGAIAFNRRLDADKLTSVEPIREGAKIRFAYLREPNPFCCHVLSAVYGCPEEWQVEKYLDYDKQFQIAVLAPLNAILNLVGWTAEHQVSLFD
jgi:DNA polymerase elongation subunit (family B)